MDEQTEKGEWYVLRFSAARCPLLEDKERVKLIHNRGFKALKQMTKMNYLYRHQPDEALKTYRELLGYTKVSHSAFFSSSRLSRSGDLKSIMCTIADLIRATLLGIMPKSLSITF